MSSERIRIFLPFRNAANLFLEELIHYSKHEWVFGNLDEYDPSFQIVNIHWPEAIFDWAEPTPNQIRKLEECIAHWREHSVIVNTRHNHVPHRAGDGFQKLYQLISEKSDCFIHLGQFSLQQMDRDEAISRKHVVIPHHIYTLYPAFADAEGSRKALGLRPDAKIILVPGVVRSRKEQKFILDTFRRVQARKKLLLVPRMTFFAPGWLEKFPGLLKIAGAMKLWLYQLTGRYFLKDTFVDHYSFQLYCKACDVMFVPRLDTLNSGIPFLGMSFSRAVAGPDTGNIGEALRDAGNSVYQNSDAADAADVITAILNGEKVYTPDPAYLHSLHPETIAARYAELFTSLITAKFAEKTLQSEIPATA